MLVLQNWTESGSCEYGDACLFAHGEAQLKAYGASDPAYKTVMCKNWMAKKECQWGEQCKVGQQFIVIHDKYSHSAS